VVEQLDGVFFPFSDLEQAILPARVRDFRPAMLDELGALGELVWIGGGAGAGEDGRVALYRRARAPLLLDPPPAGELTDVQRALLAALEQQGATFYAQLAAAAPAATTVEIVDALWALAWAGLVTNDTFQPLRARGAARRRNLVAEAAGRWSAVSSLLRPSPSPTERLHARATAALDRYGVVSRETAAAEDWPGGFSSVLPVLRALEEAGKIRRGHFVDGFSGAEFAHPGAVDRLRAARAAEPEAVVALAAVDPANPYGALVRWPEGESDAPRRVAGARVVLVDGAPVIYVERGGRGLRILPPWALDEGRLASVVNALRAGKRSLRVERINGIPALRSDLAADLRRAGFRMEPGALILDPAS